MLLSSRVSYPLWGCFDLVSRGERKRYLSGVSGNPSASAFPSQVHVNPSQSVLVLEGDDIESFNRAVQQVTYRNSLRFATPGVRPLKLATSLRYPKRTHTPRI